MDEPYAFSNTRAKQASGMRRTAGKVGVAPERTVADCHSMLIGFRAMVN